MSDAKKAQPEIEINFQGEKVKLVFSLDAFCKLEEATGVNALDGNLWTNFNASVLSALLWAGLLTHKPELTLENVRKSLTLTELLSLYSDINEAFKNASPPVDEKKSEPAAA